MHPPLRPGPQAPWGSWGLGSRRKTPAHRAPRGAAWGRMAATWRMGLAWGRIMGYGYGAAAAGGRMGRRTYGLLRATCHLCTGHWDYCGSQAVPAQMDSDLRWPLLGCLCLLRPSALANCQPLLLVVGVGTAGVVRGEMRNVRWCLAQDRRFSLPPEP
jgi:hypothetical protein